MAGAVLVTDEAVVAHRTEAVSAAGALEAIFAQAGTADVVAPGAILAVALMGTLVPIGAQGTLLLTPETGGGEGHQRSPAVIQGHPRRGEVRFRAMILKLFIPCYHYRKYYSTSTNIMPDVIVEHIY